MAQNLFVQLKLGGNSFEPTQISIKGCAYVDDFKQSIKIAFAKKLESFDSCDIVLFEADGTSHISAMDTIDQLCEKKMPLVAIVTPPVMVVEKPVAISITRHQDYKHSKAVHSSRSFLTTIASELNKIYPIPGRESKGTRYVTIGDVFREAYVSNPEPNPQFMIRYKQRLNEFYTSEEWNILEQLNNAVNPELHTVLAVLFDGHSKEVIVPIEASHLVSEFQRIAKKTNVVSDALHLIVKNEGSVSGGSPDADKHL